MEDQSPPTSCYLFGRSFLGGNSAVVVVIVIIKEPISYAYRPPCLPEKCGNGKFAFLVMIAEFFYNVVC